MRPYFLTPKVTYTTQAAAAANHSRVAAVAHFNKIAAQDKHVNELANLVSSDTLTGKQITLNFFPMPLYLYEL